MKKLTAMIASLLVLCMLVSAFSVVYADDSDAASYPVETTGQETIPEEYEPAPAFCGPQKDDLSDPAPGSKNF